MVFLLIGFGLAAGLWVLLNWWANAKVKTAKNGLLWAIIAVCAVLGLLLYSRAGAVSALLPGAVALWRMGSIARAAASMANKMGRGAAQQSQTGQMDKREALKVLGLEEGASKSDVNAAYKRLMSQCHPDKGGSDWMAARLNEAKRILLSE